MEIKKFKDNPFNLTYVLNKKQFDYLIKHDRIKKLPQGGLSFIRRFWFDEIKIRTLITLSEKLKNKSEKTKRFTFEDHGKAYYSGKNARNILLEQSIVAMVSAWEKYFRSIFRYLLDHETFISSLISNEKRFEKFLTYFKISHDFSVNFAIKKGDMSNLYFGTNIIENRRINFQNIENLNFLMKVTFPNIHISKYSENWTKIRKLFKDRHTIIHAGGEEEREVEDYDYDEEKEIVHGPYLIKRSENVIWDYDEKLLKALLNDESKIIEKVNDRLFSQYIGDDLELCKD